MGVDGNVVAGDAADRDPADGGAADQHAADDEAALSWSGETDPTHIAAPARASARATSVGKSTATAGTEVKAAPLNPLALVIFGILAGAYLLFAVGWVVLGFSSSVPVQGVFFSIMYQVGEALAIASPFLWAAAVWLRVKKPSMRILWLFVGAVVLAPWPFLVGGLG